MKMNPFVFVIMVFAGFFAASCASAPKTAFPVVDGMILLPGGTFTMGSPSSEPGRKDDEGPEHEVTLLPFWIGEKEVTQKEYQELMGENPSETKGDALPVGNITWFDAVNYCNARSAKEGLVPAYTVEGESVTWNRNVKEGRPGYRLPTEAEWEYACRAGTVTAYSYGETITPKDADYDQGKAVPAGTFPPNPWGAYDMHGNVSEWCWDRYREYSPGDQRNPSGGVIGGKRLSRGGSWAGGGAEGVRSGARSALNPWDTDKAAGFRLARSPDDPPPLPPGFEAEGGMVRLPEGTFTMGSALSAAVREEDETPREAKVSSFWIGQYEITQKEYRELMGADPSAFKGDDLPVENVTWFDAVNYCNARSVKEGLSPAYTVDGETVTWNRDSGGGKAGYRLPTEAEWEYACRAGTESVFNWGDSITPEDARYESAAGPRPVGTYLPNAWGLYDMHGNVSEWCWDWYGDYSGGADNPAGVPSGESRVLRSGPWNAFGPALRSANRLDLSPGEKNSGLGFRIVRDY